MTGRVKANKSTVVDEKGIEKSGSAVATAQRVQRQFVRR